MKGDFDRLVQRIRDRYCRASEVVLGPRTRRESSQHNNQRERCSQSENEIHLVALLRTLILKRQKAPMTPFRANGCRNLRPLLPKAGEVASNKNVGIGRSQRSTRYARVRWSWTNCVTKHATANSRTT